MFHYANQRAALVQAAKLVEELPLDTVFSVTVTDDEEDAVLNIYGERSLVKLLHMDHLTIADEGDNFVTYMLGPLEVSFIQEETSNG